MSFFVYIGSVVAEIKLLVDQNFSDVELANSAADISGKNAP
jgi:hypothetical protein